MGRSIPHLVIPAEYNVGMDDNGAVGLSGLGTDCPGRPTGDVGPTHLSPSSAATFTQCPRRWRFRYLDRLADPPTVPALAGTLVHRVLERLLAEPHAERTAERAKALAGEEWPAHAAHPDLTRLGLGPEETRSYKWRVWHAILGLWHVEDPASVQVAATEQRLEVSVGSVPFVGVVDRVDATPEGLVVTDYKSGRPPSAHRTGEKLEQVLWYTAAVAAAGFDHPVRARLLYLGNTAIEVSTTTEVVAGAVARLEEQWRQIQAGVARDDFEPRTGPLCAYCPFLERCPQGRREVAYRYEVGLVAANAPGLRLVAA